MDNTEKVEKWLQGIHDIFLHIQQKNNWSKKEAWDKLKVQLINEVDERDFNLDDLSWVESILLYDKNPSTLEVVRVSQRYLNSTPLLNSLNSLI